MAVGFAPVQRQLVEPASTVCRPSPFVAGDSNYPAGQSPAAAGRGYRLDGFNVATYAGGTVPGTINLLTGFGHTLDRGHGQPRLRSQRGDTRLRIHRSRTSASCWVPTPTASVVVMVQDGQVNASYRQG